MNPELEKYKDKKIEIKNKSESDRIAAILKKETFVVGDIKETKKKKVEYTGRFKCSVVYYESAALTN